MQRRLVGHGFSRVLVIAIAFWVVNAFLLVFRRKSGDSDALSGLGGGNASNPPRTSASSHGVKSWFQPNRHSQATKALMGHKNLNPENITETNVYVNAILNPELTTFDELNCSKPLDERYDYLRGRSSWRHTKPKYFFALDLHQSRHIIARLLASILESVKFLGPKHCAISIVEGRSTDGTYDILIAIQPALKRIGVEFHLAKNDDLNPNGDGVDRFEALAQLRNQALAPMLENPSRYHEETTVIFSNDISLCVNDILELIHQRDFQKADLACAMDYSNDGLFYDVWISRGMTGDIFFEIPPSGLWANAKDLFWNDAKAKRRLDAKRPLQVYACWNGIAVFTGKPLMERDVKFRSTSKGECVMGEPTLFCHDFWVKGFGRIMVVPSVWVAYGNSAIEKVKRIEGYAEQHVLGKGPASEEKELIDWLPEPPPEVKCLIPSMADPTWVDSTTFIAPPRAVVEAQELFNDNGIPEAALTPPTTSSSPDIIPDALPDSRPEFIEKTSP